MSNCNLKELCHNFKSFLPPDLQIGEELTFKITQFTKVEKHRNKDGPGWRRLRWIVNGERPIFSRSTNCDVAPLKLSVKIALI